MSANSEEYKGLDHPALLNFIFYPRPDDYILQDSSTVRNYDLPAGEGNSISCTFYFREIDAANILFFHGNGELAGEYVDVGSLFNEIGINLFVADYRGYGRSSGKPTVSNMLGDAHSIFKGFKDILSDGGFKGEHFIMGRSLGSASAVELAEAYQDEWKGLVIESGFCDIADLLKGTGLMQVQEESDSLPSPGLERVRRIKLPALIIHGEYDSIVPLQQGQNFFTNLASENKDMVVIPGADHNTIFAEGMQLYMQELKQFIGRNL